MREELRKEQDKNFNLERSLREAGTDTGKNRADQERIRDLQAMNDDL